MEELPDQWIVEGLANYSALLVLEQRDPAQFRQAMERYRTTWPAKNKNGEPMRTAGPVTLGQRLVSSHFPEGYEAISYERARGCSTCCAACCAMPKLRPFPEWAYRSGRAILPRPAKTARTAMPERA